MRPVQWQCWTEATTSHGDSKDSKDSKDCKPCSRTGPVNMPSPSCNPGTTEKKRKSCTLYLLYIPTNGLLARCSMQTQVQTLADPPNCLYCLNCFNSHDFHSSACSAPTLSGLTCRLGTTALHRTALHCNVATSRISMPEGIRRDARRPTTDGDVAQWRNPPLQ